jgi:N-acetylglucosamine-6-sulfatase
MRFGRAGVAVLAAACLVGSCTSSPRKPRTTGSPIPTSPVSPTGSGTAGSGKRPNVLILLSDDQAFRLFTPDLMPRTFSQLVDQGVDFTRNYVNDSECCPSRATIMTGLYSHDTGVDSNFRPLDGTTPARPTFVQALHEAGYRTMLDGKYLNSESCAPQPGWDQWICGKDQQMTEVNPILTVAGHTGVVHGYTADILADHAIDFIRANADPNHPFFVYYTPRDPHLPANDPRAASMRIPPYRPPSYNAPIGPNAPRWTQLPPLGPKKIKAVDDEHTKMAQQLPPLDADIGRILSALGNRANDTLVIYMSDNGFMYGEHRMTDKTQPYEESVRVPLVLRWPAILPPSRHFVSNALTENIDLAPTIMDAAGISWAADGTSLLPLLAGTTTHVHDGVLTEWCQAGLGPCPHFSTGLAPPYWGLETERYAYVEYSTGERELYDLQADPYELRNLSGDPAEAGIMRQLSAQLAALRTPRSPPDTTIAVGPTASSGSVSFDYFSQSRETGFECMLAGPGQAAAWKACDGGRASFRGLGGGTYTFQVRARGAAGTLDPTPASRTFTLPA